MTSFKKQDNPLVSLGIGQRAQITKWLDEMDVIGYTINDDFTIDVNGDVDLSFTKLVEFPDYIQFNYVNGYFNCSNNYLISLKGCPL
jgi:hypothetical protein